MKILVGLGNPGTRYEKTRHNLGFWVIDMLSSRWQIPLTKHKFQAKLGEGVIRGERVTLVKPQTFMNRSGQSVGPLANFWKVSMEDVLVIYDDMALAPGMIRARAKGSAGGHNGMKSIISHLGGDEFPRLRMGIGSPPEFLDSAEYVLQGLDADNFRILQNACADGADAAELWITYGINKVMNTYNRKQTTTEED